MNQSSLSPAPALALEGVSRRFSDGERVVTVLEGLDFRVERGERVAVMGASGSGKSTLLNLAAGMDRPDEGRVRLLDEALDAIDEPELTRFRARHVGLVFQDFNLIDSLSVRENIALPLWLNGLDDMQADVDGLSETLGIAELMDRLPDQLSGGEKQRVAIARALVHRPEVLLADEPTGSLDEASAERVLALFDRVTAESGCALVLVTHNPQAAAVCDRQLQLRGGRLKQS
ncbi:ABC transporter ATP-binding protein [Wenzhouxiangella sp. EGI_FJ10305]|uniref:ABC transporter ATP-binding protein n=1 Tax=Wenzhouxiangella sp. EGI_FJ10305 TaxID=3243768 RepID=UPI0035E2AECA